jgi:TetR/AcrR family transcriptional regulator, transcriptional repressor for nem operon
MARTKQFDEDQVLERAVAQFWAYGFNGTSIQDLVANLGLSRSSIYDTYTDKRQLFLTSLSRYAEQSTQTLVTLITESEDIIKTISLLLTGPGHSENQARQPKGCFLVNTITELASRDAEALAIAKINNEKVIQALIWRLKKDNNRDKLIAPKAQKPWPDFYITILPE